MQITRKRVRRKLPRSRSPDINNILPIQETTISCHWHKLMLLKEHRKHYNRHHKFNIPTSTFQIFKIALFSTLLLLFLSVFNFSMCQTLVAQASSPITPPKNLNHSSIHELVRPNINNVANINNIDHQHTAIPLADAKRKYVTLGNNTSSSLRSLTYANSHISNHNFINSRQNISSDPSPGRSSDNQQVGQKKNTFEKICIGTSNRMSGQHNKTDHYQNLVERYRNCTHVTGNLEITWLEKSIDGRPLDLTFLESIREITGYLLIAYVEVEEIKMPNLQIVRGRDFFKLNNGNDNEFAMFLLQNQLRTLELPNLREILAGSVGFYNNERLCHVRTINWDEILNIPYRSIFVYDVYNETLSQCPQCHESCQNGCWGEGPEMCQKFSKTNCSPQCTQGRCFGNAPRECCHLFCAGGCVGPKQTDCIACKNFSDDGECIQECPSMQRYNPSKFLWESNPNGKYAFGANCVKECPEHLLRDNGACVRTCPPNKRSVNGECVPCGGPCPKNCQGVEVVHSGNINQLVNCTVIDGSISILDTSFTGYAELYTNNTIGTRYKEMHPSSLEVLKTLREITGYLNIQASHKDFRNLFFLRNLKIIGGSQTTDTDSSLAILRTSLVELNLHSLRKVKTGKILIEGNRDLCFADTIAWSRINITRREEIVTKDNAEASKCRKLGLYCHDQCTKDGCWGPGPDECLSCNSYKLEDYCVDNCTSNHNGILSYDSGNRTCKKCHTECKDGCNGIEARNCFSCKNVKDGPYCVPECPGHKYNNNGTCEECDKSCIDGCTGPSNRLGEGGCNSCSKAIINSTDPVFVGHCIKAEEACPEGYYQEYVGPQPEGPLKSSSGKPVCKKCHSRCKSCTGFGTHKLVCECARFTADSNCEENCPRDYFADEPSRQCLKCATECNGCFGPSEADCISCKVYRIYYDTGDSNPIALAHVSGANKMNLDTGATKIQVKFNCTAQCPPNKPHRISGSNMLDPYCSEVLDYDAENARITSLGPTSIAFMIITSAAITLCVAVYRYHEHDNKTLKLSMRLSGIDTGEPVNPSNIEPNLAVLRTIKETELRKGKILGRGFGGTVYQGIWYVEGQEHKGPIPVAIKVLNDKGKSSAHREFLDEAYIMATINHPNLVRLLGICTTPNQLMLVTPLMALGGLAEYVRNKQNEIGSKDLLEWSKQIAKGMAYLEERQMLHRDLALRNVLLQRPGSALISDFGLSKILDVDQSEYNSAGGRLPIKWLAPECMSKRIFTHKSDVWAFGVTIWELLTFGLKPFENYDTTEISHRIEEGARLEQPIHVSAEVYKVMYACWFYNPEDRPDFKTLAESFVNFARDPARYLDLARAAGYSKGSELSSSQTLIRSSDSDDNGFEGYGSEANSLTGGESQQRPILPELITSTKPGRVGEGTPLFELRNHSESSENGHSKHVTTPTLKRIAMFQSSGQQLDEDVFFTNPQNHSANKTPMAQIIDMNNNNFGSNANTSINPGSCWSMHHTVSTTSLGKSQLLIFESNFFPIRNIFTNFIPFLSFSGQKSSQLPLDNDDYLLPSPCSNGK